MCFFDIVSYTLPETNSSPLKNGGWKLEDDPFLLGTELFRGKELNFRWVYFLQETFFYVDTPLVPAGVLCG